MIVDLDGGPDGAPGRDRRRAMALAFVLCLAVASAGLGRDAPAATQATRPDTTMFFSRGGVYVGAAPADQSLSLPPNTTDVLLSFIPDRLANEAWPALAFVPVRVRAVSGLAVEARRPGDYQMVTWTEGGNAYWLVSDRREIADLLRVADSLR